MSKLTSTLFLLILLTVSSFAQDLVLSGKASFYAPTGEKKIYYAEKGKDFDLKKFIIPDAKGDYTFKISLLKIRESKIEAISFTPDSSAIAAKEYICSHNVNVGKIVALPQFQSAKSIKLRSDLPFFSICHDMVASPAASLTDDGKFTGEYEMQLNGTSYKVILTNEYLYKATLSQPTPELITEEEGRWSYDPSEKTLLLNVEEQSNKQMGLILNKRKVCTFKVSEVAGKLQFTGTNAATLIKL